MQNKKIQLWALAMSGYYCTIEYIKGTTNTCADLLSRHPAKVKSSCDKDDSDSSTNDIDINDIENAFTATLRPFKAGKYYLLRANIAPSKNLVKNLL